jgi:hypothetical protein
LIVLLEHPAHRVVTPGGSAAAASMDSAAADVCGGLAKVIIRFVRNVHS